MAFRINPLCKKNNKHVKKSCVPCVIGPVVLSTPAQIIAPVIVARGTLSITTTEIYFEVDEDDPTFRRIDAKVGYIYPLSICYCAHL